MCCIRFLVKCLLFIINLLFTLLGIAIVVLGVLIKLKLAEYIKEAEDYIISQADGDIDVSAVLPDLLGSVDIIAYVVIAIGVVIFLIAFCGCCGSVVESKCLLITYSTFIAMLAALKIVALVLLLTNMDDLKNEAGSFVEEAFDNPQYNITFHVIEALLQCCGTHGPDSYDITYEGVSYTPPTCCKEPQVPAIDGIEGINTEDLPVNITVCLKEESYEIGCATKFVTFVDDVLIYSRNILIFVIAAELVLLFFAIYVTCTIETPSKSKKSPQNQMYRY